MGTRLEQTEISITHDIVKARVFYFILNWLLISIRPIYSALTVENYVDFIVYSMAIYAS